MESNLSVIWDELLITNMTLEADLNATENFSSLTRHRTNWCYLGYQKRKDPSYYEYKLYMEAVIVPLISVFGLFANLLVTFVYTRESMRVVSVNVYLCALACSDICVILSSVFMFTFDVLRTKYWTIAEIYGSLIKMVYPVGMFFQTFSVYVTVCACVQCYLCVRYTVTMRVLRMPRPRIVLPLIALFSLAFNFLKLFEVRTDVCIERGFGNAKSILVAAHSIRYNWYYNFWYYSVGYTGVMVAGPLVLLMYLASWIVYQTYKGPCRFQFQADVEAKGDTINLVMVVVMFIACNSLTVTVNVMEAVMGREPVIIRYLSNLSNLLVTVNSSVNFLIYHKFSIKFRRILVSTFCRSRCLARKRNRIIRRLQNGPSKPSLNNNGNRRSDGRIDWSYRSSRQPAIDRLLADGEAEYWNQLSRAPSNTSQKSELSEEDRLQSARNTDRWCANRRLTALSLPHRCPSCHVGSGGLPTADTLIHTTRTLAASFGSFKKPSSKPQSKIVVTQADGDRDRGSRPRDYTVTIDLNVAVKLYCETEGVML